MNNKEERKQKIDVKRKSLVKAGMPTDLTHKFTSASLDEVFELVDKGFQTHIERSDGKRVIMDVAELERLRALTSLALYRTIEMYDSEDYSSIDSTNNDQTSNWGTIPNKIV